MKWKIRWKVGNQNFCVHPRVVAGKAGRDDSAFAEDFNLAFADESEVIITDPPTRPVTQSDWLPAILDRLDSFSILGEDWDGYGAAAPTQEAIATASGFARELATSWTVTPPTVSPTRDGGVMFSWKRDSHRLEVRFVSQSTVSYAYLDTKTGKSEKGVLLVKDGDGRFWIILESYFSS